MAPVITTAVDQLVPQANQTIAIYATIAVAIVSFVLVIRLCANRQVWWPLLILISGTLASMQEPLYDHLFGLWVYEQGQITAYTTYGIHVPLWLPIIYFAYYGCGTMWLWS